MNLQLIDIATSTDPSHLHFVFTLLTDYQKGDEVFTDAELVKVRLLNGFHGAYIISKDGNNVGIFIISRGLTEGSKEEYLQIDIVYTIPKHWEETEKEYLLGTLIAAEAAKRPYIYVFFKGRPGWDKFIKARGFKNMYNSYYLNVAGVNNG